MATSLIVHHTPSPNCRTMSEAVVSSATAPETEGVRVVRRAALSATASDVLDADGYLLGTPANLGCMSGALKHFFDQVYYPCLDATRDTRQAVRLPRTRRERCHRRGPGHRADHDGLADDARRRR